MAATTNHLDLTPPPVVKKISQRSLVVGVIFAAIAVALMFLFPDGRQEFYRAYLLGFMAWLGVALGSMAILMIRHLTGGGWGMVIRRILGAAMRTLPLLTVLFIPIVIAVLQHRIYPWAIWTVSPDAVREPHIHEHLAKNGFILSSYLNSPGFIIRAIVYFAVWNVVSFLLSHWSRQTDREGHPDNTQKF